MFLFPYSMICICYWFGFRWGMFESQARWVVLAYIGLDIVLTIVSGGHDGVGHLAHIGGFAAGLLFAAGLPAGADRVQGQAPRVSRGLFLAARIRQKDGEPCSNSR